MQILWTPFLGQGRRRWKFRPCTHKLGARLTPRPLCSESDRGVLRRNRPKADLNVSLRNVGNGPTGEDRQRRRPHFSGRLSFSVGSVLWFVREAGDGRMWWLILIASFASIPLSAEMARERERSARVWLWIALLVGPLVPLALLLLGQTKRPMPEN